MSDSQPTPSQARQMLTQANQLASDLPSAMPVMFVTFAGLCATASMSLVAFHLLDKTPSVPGENLLALVMTCSLAWVLVSIIPVVIVRDRLRRGTGTRWSVMIGAWSALWMAGISSAKSNAVYVVAPLFAILFIISFAFELHSMKQAKLAAGS